MFLSYQSENIAIQSSFPINQKIEQYRVHQKCPLALVDKLQTTNEAVGCNRAKDTTVTSHWQVFEMLPQWWPNLYLYNLTLIPLIPRWFTACTWRIALGHLKVSRLPYFRYITSSYAQYWNEEPFAYNDLFGILLANQHMHKHTLLEIHYTNVLLTYAVKHL